MFCLQYGMIRAAGRMAQSACCCLCCMICGGPILFVAGIIILMAPNTREEDVNAYNSAAKLFESTPVVGWTGTIGVQTATQQSDEMEVESGSMEGIDSFTSVYRQALVSGEPATVNYTLATVAPITATMITTYFSSYDKVESGTATCTSSSGCSGSSATSICQDKYGSTARTTSSCNKDKSCYCEYTTYLSTYCIVVAETAAGSNYSFDLSPTYKSCFYPFSSVDTQKFKTTTTNNIPFQLRLNTDPFIVMQRITKGDMDFGLTLAQQRMIGLVLLSIGCIMVACVGVISFILYKIIQGFRESSAKKEGGSMEAMLPFNNNNSGGNQYNNLAPPQHQQQYPPQQYHNPPPQQGYVQGPPPPPHYAQPQAGYAPQQHQQAMGYPMAQQAPQNNYACEL